MRKHPLSKKQNIIISILLNKIQLEDQKQKDVIYENIKVLGSDYTNLVFISFLKIGISSSGEADEKKIYWSIDVDGEVNDNAMQTMDFQTLADKVHFFNTLFEIDHDNS